jgi:hypothetical protein
VKNHSQSSLYTKLDKAVDIEAFREEYQRVKNEAIPYPHPTGAGKNFALSIFSSDGSSKTIAPFSVGHVFVPTSVASKTPKTTAFIKSLKGKIFAVRYLISKKESGLFIHRDHDVNLSFGIVRLHVPLYSSPEAMFIVEKQRLNLPPDGIYFVDVSKLHATKNAFSEERVHLVIDIGLTAELLRLFPKEFIRAKKKECEFQLFPEKLPAKEKRLRLASLHEGIYSIDRTLIPECLKGDNSDRFEIKKLRSKAFLIASNGNEYEILPFNKSSFYCPTVGPGFTFKSTQKDLQTELFGKPRDAGKWKTKLITVKGISRRVAR